MKQHFLVIGILLLILGFISCKKMKQDEINATIYVKQYKTGLPIANARVVITKGGAGSGVGSIEVETLYTNSEGKVDYNRTNADDGYMYYAEAYKDRYFDTHNQQMSLIRGEKNFETSIFMYAESYVKLHVKNMNPFNQYDLFEISTFCKHWYFQGVTIDSTILFCDYGNRFMGNFENYAYSAIIKKHAIDSVLHLSFIPSPHDTITININY